MTAVLGWAYRLPGEPAPDALGRLVARIPSDPKPSRHGRYLRRMGLFAVEVAAEALAHAGVAGGDRLGLFAAVGGLRAHWDDMMPALIDQTEDGEASWAHGLSGIHPHWLLRHLSNNAHALLARDLGARGEGATFGGANAGYQALAAACRTLAVGAADAAVVVAYDTLLEPETMVERAVRGEAGIPGEAAAAVVLGMGGPALCHITAAASAGQGPADESPIRLGAATALAQLLRSAQSLRSGEVAIGTDSAAPGLVGRIEVRLP